MKKIIFLLLFACFGRLLFGQCSNSISPSTQSVNCFGGNVSFTVTAITPTTNLRHDWYSPNNPLPNGIPVFSSTNAISVLSGNYSAGIYTVITTDLGNLCQTSQTFAITSSSPTPTFSFQAIPDYSVGCSPTVTLEILNPISNQTPAAVCSYTILPPTFTGVVTPSVILGALTATVSNIVGTWTFVIQDNSNWCRAFLQVPVGSSSVIPSFNYTVGGAGLVFFQSTSTGTNGGTTFNWDFGDGTNGSGISTSHTYSNGGVHQVILSTNNPNCFTASNPVNVNTIPCTANSGFSLAYSGTPQVWNAAPNYFGNVTNAIWNWGDGSSTNAMFPSHTYSAAGLYNICLSVTVSCANSSSSCANYNIYRTVEVTEEMTMVTVNVVPKLVTKIDEIQLEDNSVLIYPNPTNEFLTVYYAKEGKYNDFTKVEILNSIGRPVIENQLNFSDKQLKLDIKDLPVGLYFINLKGDNSKIINKRFVISR